MIAILLVLLFFLSGCAQGPKIPEVPTEAGLKPPGVIQLTLKAAQEKSIGLSVDTVMEREIPSKVTLTGRVQAASPLLAHVYSLVPGQAVQVPVWIGQTISKGQTLASIRADEIGQLEGDLLQALLQLDQDIREAQVQLEFSKSAFNREDYLFKANVSAKSEVEAASSQYRKDTVILNGLRAKRQATIRTYQERLALFGVPSGTAAKVVASHHIEPYTSIRSPKSGLLIERNINAGELVDTSKELFQVADLSKVWIIGDVFEKDIQRVKKGQSVEVQLDSQPNTRFMGTVDMVGAMLDPQTRTLDVRVETMNPDAWLKPNMFARMSIVTGQQRVLTIPKSAIQQSGDHIYVYVPTGPHRYEERQVTVNLTNEPYVEVLSGLEAGEKVVSQGSLALKGEVLKASSNSLLPKPE